MMEQFIEDILEDTRAITFILGLKSITTRQLYKYFVGIVIAQRVLLASAHIN
jgi:hypothetical protein